MKVVHIAAGHRADDIRIYQKECVSLAKNGFDVTFITGECQNPFLPDKLVKVIQLKLPKGISRLKHPFKYNKYKRDLRNKLLETALLLNADIYHVHEFELLKIGLKLKKRTNATLIYDVHEDTPRQLLDRSHRSNRMVKLIRKCDSWLLEKNENSQSKRCEAIITATPFIAKRFEKFHKKVVPIHNYPIISSEFKKIEEKMGNWICYVGNINPIRGITQLIDGIENLDVRLQLAGSISKEYLQVLNHKKGWRNVDSYGYVNKNTIKEIYEKASIGLVTLLPGKNIINSLPIKMFEYMEAGLPVIASDFPLWKEIIEKNNCGICVNPTNTLEVKEAISYLMKNPGIINEMGSNGRKAVEEKYNWLNEEKNLINLYEELMKEIRA